jgi:hypothetical protein
MNNQKESAYQNIPEGGVNLEVTTEPIEIINEEATFWKKGVEVSVARILAVSGIFLVTIGFIALNNHPNLLENDALSGSSNKNNDVYPCKTSCDLDNQCGSYWVSLMHTSLCFPFVFLFFPLDR